MDNPSNQFEIQKDDNIKEEMKTPAFQRAFLMLLVTTYIDFKRNGSIDYDPPEVLSAKQN